MTATGSRNAHEGLPLTRQTYLLLIPSMENYRESRPSPGQYCTPIDGQLWTPVDTERQSHYFYTRLAQQFDALIHIDETSAVEPLDVGQVWSEREAPETFPSGI